jgi:hypothetical protein
MIGAVNARADVRATVAVPVGTRLSSAALRGVASAPGRTVLSPRWSAYSARTRVWDELLNVQASSAATATGLRTHTYTSGSAAPLAP